MTPTDFDREALRIAGDCGLTDHQDFRAHSGGIPPAYAGYCAKLTAFAHAIRDLLVPEGSVVVPREPTEKMIEGAFGAEFPRRSSEIYKLMIAAAEGEK